MRRYSLVSWRGGQYVDIPEQRAEAMTSCHFACASLQLGATVLPGSCFDSASQRH